VEMLRAKRGAEFPAFPVHNTDGTWSVCVGTHYVSGASPVEALLRAVQL
jgi:hypothetical protein